MNHRDVSCGTKIAENPGCCFYESPSFMYKYNPLLWSSTWCGCVTLAVRDASELTWWGGVHTFVDSVCFIPTRFSRTPLALGALRFFGFRSWRCCLGNWIVWRLSGFLWQCYCSLCALFCCHMQHPVLITCLQLFKTSCCMCWCEEKETVLTNA